MLKVAQSRYHVGIHGKHGGWLILFLGAFLLALPARSQQQVPQPPAGPDPEAYVKLGVEHASSGDLEGAISAFNSALKINPQWGPAYMNKGRALLQQHKLDEAITNFDHALQLDAKYEEAMYYRGVAKAGQARFDEAIADFSSAIVLDPKYAGAYQSRGLARYFKNDLDGAITDTTQAMTLDPKLTENYFIRGLAKRAKDDHDGETADFKKSSDAGFAYGAFWFWIVKKEDSEEGLARQNLSDFLGKHEVLKHDWTKYIGDFLLERISQDDLLSRAGMDDPASNHVCEAWFFIGVVKRISGDIKGAQDSFQKAMANGTKESVEYAGSQRELANLPKL